jgi:hypothetical protein
MGHKILVVEDSLYCTYDDQLDPVRFIKAFQKVWTKIPEHARQLVLKHWREGVKEGLGFEKYVPMIRYTAEDFPGRQGAAAGCNVEQLDYRWTGFYAPIMEIFTDSVYETVIAHELGHVYARSIGEHNREYDRAKGKDDPEEVLVDEYITEWGFDAATARTTSAR